jgi:hypothetical protein
MWEIRNEYKFLIGKLGKKRDHSEDLSEDGRIILKWVSGK